ncbi:MAG TPA: hypothetical protein DDW42_03815 [Desulfobacteraceae bacterium]|nr:hypothetical protein [Desulfobacteraceae bacterium]
MYTSFFGLNENPFNLTPDPRYLFLSPHHKEALDHLLYGVNERKGFIAITGGIGTGKTTLCRAFLSHLDPQTKSALIFNSFISDKELLETINQEFGIETEYPAGTKKDHIDTLNNFLLHAFSRGGNVVLLIDEAQNLSNTVLEQLRMISNLETEKEKLIQIVLVGQSELKELLISPSLRQLNERITVRYDLRPLDPGDIYGYVEHRLVVAGGKGNLRFTNGALKKIYLYSKGNPRRINAVCDRALLIAYARGKHNVSKEIVGKAVDEIRVDMTIDRREMRWSGKRLVSNGILLLFLIMLGVLAGWSYRADISKIVFHKKIETAAKTKSLSKPIMVKMKIAGLILDEQNSLAGLFRLFDLDKIKDTFDKKTGYLGLVSFDMKPEYYVMFKKPFRIHLSDPPSSSSPSSHYILIRKVTSDGAIAVDAEGKERVVTGDFVFKNWGGEVSWIYPFNNTNINLVRGTSSPKVLKVQGMLNETGYVVKPTGVYDKETFSEIGRFQNDYGLIADGIAGPRTMALLYLMID